jgi:protein-tyrosine phosphatase
MSSKLYLGNYTNNTHYSQYALIVNLDFPYNYAQKGELKYKDILVKKDQKTRVIVAGVDDAEDENIGEYFNALCKIIDQYLKDKKRVLIHCRAGISRSPTIVIAYLIFKGMSHLNASKLVKMKRNIVNPNQGFINQLVQYERSRWPKQ